MKFSEIPGHVEFKKRLVSMHKNARVSHAMMFMGEEGSANLALSIAFAQFISCESPEENDSCGRCPTCLKIQNHAHPDLHYYFPTTTSSKVPKKPILSQLYYEEWREFLQDNMFVTRSAWLQKMNPDRKDAIISADDSAQIIKDISLKSFEGKNRIAIIWLPEKFNTTSSNRLLKIIEEPPKGAYFILVTENSELVLQTIVSRTQNMRIGKIHDDEMRSWLSSEHFNYSGEEISAMIKAGDGNPLHALEYQNEEALSKELIEYFINWARLAYKAYEKMPELIKYSEEIAAKTRAEQNSILFYGISFFRNALLINNGGTELTNLHPDESKHVQNFAPLLKVENCTLLGNAFEKTLSYLDRYANSKILFLDLSLLFAKNINSKNVNL